jgi:hypothetical protein
MRTEMEDDDITKLLAEAIVKTQESVISIEVVQQFFAIYLSKTNPEEAKQMAKDLLDISNSEKIETSDTVRDYMKHISEFLNGSNTTPIRGLLMPLENPKNPAHWLRGIIKGGKE